MFECNYHKDLSYTVSAFTPCGKCDSCGDLSSFHAARDRKDLEADLAERVILSIVDIDEGESIGEVDVPGDQVANVITEADKRGLRAEVVTVPRLDSVAAFVAWLEG